MESNSKSRNSNKKIPTYHSDHSGLGYSEKSLQSQKSSRQNGSSSKSSRSYYSKNQNKESTIAAVSATTIPTNPLTLSSQSQPYSSSSKTTTYSNNYQNQLLSQNMKLAGKANARSNQTQNQKQNQNHSSKGNNYSNSSSTGALGLSLGRELGLDSAATYDLNDTVTSTNIVDADFSDHFVVRRQKLQDDDSFSGKYGQIKSHDDNFDDIFTINQDHDYRQIHSQPSNLQQNSSSLNDASFNVLDTNANANRQSSDGDQEKQRKDKDKAGDSKKVWTPFQFGKRAKTSGISPLLDGKRSSKGNLNGIPYDGIIPPNSGISAKCTRPLYMFKNSDPPLLLQTEALTPGFTNTSAIPGRAHAFMNSDSSYPCPGTETANSNSKVNLLTGSGTGNNSNSSNNALRNALSVLRPFTAGEVTPQSKSTVAQFSEYQDNQGNVKEEASPELTNPINIYHDHDYRQELSKFKDTNNALHGVPEPTQEKIQSQSQGQGHGKPSRLPFGYYSKQYLRAISENSNENQQRHNLLQSQNNSNSIMDSSDSKSSGANVNIKNRYTTQIKNQKYATIGSRQNSQTSLVQEKPSKPNVYRNWIYSTNYTPIVPESASVFDDGSESSSYFLKELDGSDAKATGTAMAAKGDGPGMLAKFGSAAVDIPESLVVSNPVTTSSLSFMRPKTVCENQVSYTQKLSVDSMVKQPKGRANGSMGINPYYQQNFMMQSQGRVQNQSNNPRSKGLLQDYNGVQATSVIPHHDNIMSTSITKANTSGVSHPQSQKLILSHNLRNDNTSPLSPFHIPIRQYIFLRPENGEPGQVQGQGQGSADFDFKNEINTSHFISDLNISSSLNSYTQSLSNLRHSIFYTCSQTNPIPMHLIFDYLVNARKVGEGVYGEVFKAYFRGMPDQRVYKIVPIEGSKIVNGEKQKKFGEVEPEIIISQELNKLRNGYNGCYTDGHCRMLYTRICQGKYPAVLIEQWKSWHRTCVSQNDLPEFEAKQLYTIFEFEYHGTDIESFKFRNAKQSMAVLLHVMHSLAAAESAMEFEHRDLHWGNILVLKTREPFTSYTVQGANFRVPNCGLKSTIIDYTISRLTNSKGQVIFTDLANDEDQFCGSEDYQFEIYRMMREENKNDWSKFCPKTNIFWAHYLVGKLIDKGRYDDTTSPTHTLFKNKLYRIQSGLLKYQSCSECIRRFLPAFCRDLETADL